MFSSSLQSFWEKLSKPEKSQTYLVCIGINCSVVSTSVLFDEANWMRVQVHHCTIHPDNKTRLCLISTTPAKPANSANHALFGGANICIINIQLLVVPCLIESKGLTNSLKRRRLFCESSDEEDLSLRSRSDAILHMSRIEFEFRPTQINLDWLNWFRRRS